MTEQINPFHILSGQVVVINDMTFYFSGPGNWIVDDEPVIEQLHREDGPAVEYENGSREWYLNGRLHRTDGPAIEYASGGKEWWLNGQKLTKSQFNQALLTTLAPSTTISHD